MSRTGRGKYPLRYIPVSKREQLHLDDYPSFHASGSISGMRKQFYDLCDDLRIWVDLL